MPIVPNYMNQANAQNWAEGLGSVVQALNNPQAFANADLLRAKKAEIEASIAYQQGKLGLERQETTAKLPVFAAQANNQNAEAAEHNAKARQNDLVGQSLQRQMQAQNGLGDAVSAAYGVNPAVGKAIQQVAIASNDSNSKQIGDMISNLGRLNPQTANPGESVFWAPGDWRMPQPPAQQGGSLVPQSQVPFSQGGGMGGQAPVGLGTAIQQGQSGPVTVGNVTTVPGNKGTTSNPTLLKLADEASNLGNSAYGVYRESQRLNNPESLANSVNPLGDGMLGNALDFVQQAMGSTSAQDRLAFKNFKVNDFLTKAAPMKGSLTEMEGAILRSGQPGSNAAQEVKSNWLQNVGYYAKLESDWQAANQEALQAGQPRPIPNRWKADYMAQNPPPEMAFKGSKPSGASAAASGASSELVAVTSPDGKPYKIPASNLEAALARGFKKR